MSSESLVQIGQGDMGTIRRSSNVTNLCLGIIGLGDMGKMYARCFVKSGFRVFACDLPDKYESLLAEFKDSGINVVKDGYEVARMCDFTMYIWFHVRFSVEAAFIEQVVGKYGPSMVLSSNI
jgi:prephenate dehydrogenase (NADP+)